MSLLDVDVVAFVDEVEEVDDFFVGELDAATTGGLTDFVFVVGAVEIDVAIMTVATGAVVMAAFEAFEPEDAGGYEVGFLLFIAELAVGFAYLDATFEDCPEWGVFANFLGDAMQSGGGAEGVFFAGWGLQTG